MSSQPTVADYIVHRLAREGITECFGVAGNFAFKLDDAVVRSEKIRWIGCSNEPILPVIEVASVEEVIGFINDRPNPLGLYIFAEDQSIAERILDATESGDAVVNDCTILFRGGSSSAFAL
jgi:Thiamine pyrophosphate enzyme, N-terminal TPP binding domain/Aldehyde dehydrogenase family